MKFSSLGLYHGKQWILFNIVQVDVAKQHVERTSVVFPVNENSYLRPSHVNIKRVPCSGLSKATQKVPRFWVLEFPMSQSRPRWPTFAVNQSVRSWFIIKGSPLGPNWTTVLPSLLNRDFLLFCRWNGFSFGLYISLPFVVRLGLFELLVWWGWALGPIFLIATIRAAYSAWARHRSEIWVFQLFIAALCEKVHIWIAVLNNLVLFCCYKLLLVWAFD